MFFLNNFVRFTRDLFGTRHEDKEEELQPNFVLAPWKDRHYRPVEVVSDDVSSDSSCDGEDGDSSSMIRVCFPKNKKICDVDAKSIIHYFGNMMDVSLSFFHGRDVLVGKIYGNDSPKHQGKMIDTFYIRTDDTSDIYTVPVKDIFLTSSQVKELCSSRKSRKSMFVYD